MNSYKLNINMVKPTTCIPNFVTSTNEAMEYVGLAIDRNSENFSRSIERLTAGYFTESGYVQLHEIDFSAIKEKIINAFSKLWNSIKNAFAFVFGKIEKSCTKASSQLPKLSDLKKRLANADQDKVLGEYHINMLATHSIFKYMDDIMSNIDKQVSNITDVLSNTNADDSTSKKVQLNYDNFKIPDDVNAVIKEKMGEIKNVTTIDAYMRLEDIYITATIYDTNKKRINEFYDCEYKAITTLQSKVKSCKAIDTETFNKAFTNMSNYMKFATKVGLSLLTTSYNESVSLIRAAANIKAETDENNNNNEKSKASSNESFYF